MTRRLVFSGSPWEELAGYARAVAQDGIVCVSGTVGYDAAAGRFPETAEAQARCALGIIERALVEAGAALSDVAQVRVYVPDRNDIAAVSAVLKDRLGAVRPANTTVCCPLAVAEAKVEIEVMALVRRTGSS